MYRQNWHESWRNQEKNLNHKVKGIRISRQLWRTGKKMTGQCRWLHSRPHLLIIIRRRSASPCDISSWPSLTLVWRRDSLIIMQFLCVCKSPIKVVIDICYSPSIDEKLFAEVEQQKEKKNEKIPETRKREWDVYKYRKITMSVGSRLCHYSPSCTYITSLIACDLFISK